jgi:tyramine---L-glutamate ligase
MKIFVYEYICGGGLAGRPLPESLAQEGWAMLASIVEDFARIQGCEVLAMLDDRFAGRPLSASHIQLITPTIERELIAKLSGESDWSLIIAPETDGVLLDRVRWVEQAGGRLLGPSSAAVAVASDKIECARVLRQAGVPVVGGESVDLALLVRSSEQIQYPIVLKPRDGAGSQATFLIHNSIELASAAARARQELPASEFMVQPYVRGIAASVSLLIGWQRPIALPPAEQLLSDDGRLRYCGGRLPLDPTLAGRAVSLASRAVAATPGVRGYVGVDMVLGSKISNFKSEISDFKSQISDLKSQISDSKSQIPGPNDVIIEVNPRLTTSYVGLRRLARANLAERLVRVAAGGPWQPIEWCTETIGFSAAGEITYLMPDPGIPSC